MSVVVIAAPTAHAQLTSPDPAWTCGFDGDAAAADEPSTLFAPPSGVITVPVVIHSIYAPDGTGYLTDSAIEAQVDTLNIAYAAAAQYVADRIQFKLIGLNRIKDQILFDNTLGQISSIHNQYKVDVDRVMNVYIGNNPGGIGGRAVFGQWAYARFRGFVDYLAPDGLNEGRTVVHEVGHYTSLHHTYRGGCPNISDPTYNCLFYGDMVCDTAPHTSSGNPSCPPGVNTCVDFLGPGGSDLEDPDNNYMSYTLDVCWGEFTRGQNDRARAYLFSTRPQITNRSDYSPRFPNGLTVAANQHWTFYDATPEFGANSRVDVQGGRFDAYDTTFSPESGSGWAGVRYGPGSTGDLADGTAIEGVSGYGAYALDVNNATLTIDEVAVQSPAPSSAVSGLYVRGTNADVVANRLTVRDMTVYGVLNTSKNGSLRITDSDIESNGNTGLSAGYLSETFLHPDFVHGGAPDRGVRFAFNSGDGIRASSSADVVFGYYYYPTSVPHNDGFNSVTNGQAEGVEASSYATVYGGGASFWQRNRLFDNVGLDARASGSGTSASLRCNWWNDTTPPFRTAATSGATLDDSYWLVADPYQDLNAACVSNTFGSGKSGSTTSRRTETLSARLADALAAFDRPELALAAFVEVVTSAPESDEATAAVRGVARLASLPEAPVAAQATLLTWATGTRTALRDAAHAGLISVWHRAGDPSRALEYAEVLASEAATESGALFGAVARVYLLADLGRPDDARQALDAARAVAPESDEVALAALALGDPEGAVRDPFAETKASTTRVFAVSLAPNPTRDSATLAFSLDTASHVRVAVYDVLGRQVALAHDGPAQAGFQSVDLDTSRLTPGAYIVQFMTDGTDLGGARSQQALRLTVVR